MANFEICGYVSDSADLSFHPWPSFHFVPSFWCELEVKKHTHRDMLWQTKTVLENASSDSYVNDSCTAHQNWKKRNFMKNITCRSIIPKITKLCLWFIKNIGYNQKGRERISRKCNFFLVELREISLELNSTWLKVVSCRRLQILSTFFSFFKNTWQFLKHDNVPLH